MQDPDRLGRQEAFQRDLEALGFRVVSERRTGDIQYALGVNRYLTYTVHWDLADGSVLFTWELAVGEFMNDRGMQVGSNEALNTFLFPQHDARGDEDIAFVVREMDRTEQILGSINFLEPEV